MNVFLDEVSDSTQTFATLAESLEAGQSPPVGSLLDYLQHRESSVRKLALGLLEYLNDPSSIPALLEAATDADIEVSLAAGDILRSFRNPLANKHLLDGLQNARPAVRLAAVAALGERRAPEAVGGLIQALGDLESEIRRQAVIAIANYRRLDLLLALRSGLRDESAAVRKAAVSAIAEFDGAFVFDDLIVALSDPSWPVRRAAAAALPRFEVVDTVNALRDALNDPAWQVVHEALTGLAQLKVSVGRDLPTLLFHEVADVRVAAIGATGEAGILHDIPQLQPLILDENPRVQKAARRAIDRILTTAPGRWNSKDMPKLVSPWAARLLLRLARYELAESRGERFRKLAEDARKHIFQVTPAEASAALARRVLIIDVRERDEFARGHIPKALSFPRGTLELEIERHASHLGEEIITYCGHGNRSALAAESLLRMGYSDVKTILGGFQAWLDAGLPAWRGRGFAEE